MSLEAGVMSMTIDYAKDIQNVDWFGKQDPYCILRVGGQTFRTRTAKDGGRNPVWNETFRVSLLHENDVTIDIKDEDVGCDDFIGSCHLSLSRARQAGHDHLEVPVFGTKSRKQHGFVSVKLKWAPHRAPFARPQPHPQWGAVQYGASPAVPYMPPGAMPACYAMAPPPLCQAGVGADAPPVPYGYLANTGATALQPTAYQPVFAPPAAYQ